MKAALAGLALLCAACSISHRSQDYACTKTSDCAQGRTCVDGFCVIPGGSGAPSDAPTATDAKKPDAPGEMCPPGCTSCDVAHHQCTIDCSKPGSTCGSKVVCPSGYACTIACDTQGACRDTIDCQSAASCNITCATFDSCHDVQCGDGRCQVSCIGSRSCANVSCNNACACDVSCTGSNTCFSLQCTSDACRTFPDGCTSSQPLCNSCP